jgi:uncharacterized protein YyaL (SSP411 family)
MSKVIATYPIMALVALFLGGLTGLARAQEANRLAGEKSPYLLQHASNPVDWYPWGEEAFAEARDKDKPVFLSIGYSTCHWCHVMEEESFSNPDIAALMNEHFVCIKVDREERPDIDNIYMSAVVAITGRGGWPLTVFLTPDQEPFFGGTYFPPEDRWGMSGLKKVILSVAEAWRNRRDEVNRSGRELTKALSARSARGGGTASLGESTLSLAYSHFQATFDEDQAGFGAAPKFPMGHNLSFLLRYAEREKGPDALPMVEKTLNAMADGGMYDQIGGGFHRYSTDEEWRIPHFEKMLYDQAILARAYLEAYQVTRNERYAQIARETLDYVLRDMTDKEGAFYSAEDADSPLPERPDNKKEGAFYLWTPDEVRDLLGAEEADIVSYHYGVTPEGNAITDPHGEFSGKSVLYVARTPEETASHFGIGVEEAKDVIRVAGEKLLAARGKRPRPHLDDKILTDWNGLMISSLAFASRALGEPSYRKAAERAARFILEHLVDNDGNLLHRHRDGTSGIAATIEDYAFFIHGLIDLYEATFDVGYLEKALRLADLMKDLFWDEDAGGFFFTADDSEKLIMRTKEVYDGAIPSGNSIAALDLIRLGRLTARPELEALASDLMAAFSADIAGMPSSYSFMLAALDFGVGPSREIVIAEGDRGASVDDLAGAVYFRFIPSKVVLMKPAGEAGSKLVGLAPFLAEHHAIGGKTSVYVCSNYACSTPVSSVQDLEMRLKE